MADFENRTGVSVRKCARVLAFSIFIASAPFHASADEDTAGPGFTCVPRPDVVTPDKAAPGAEDSAPLIAVCPQGQVPQPNARYSNKGIPGLSLLVKDSSSYYYFYADAFQYAEGSGMFAKISQHQPFLSRRDYHSLAEMAAQSSDAAQTVEVGWSVDPTVNLDSLTHLFVFYWVDRVPKCYNGCGWVQVSATRYPGMVVDTSSTTEQSYGVMYSSGKWWVAYQGEWIGYYPSSLWSDKFTKLGLAHWFGELSTSKSRTCGDMGSGHYADSESSATMSTLSIIKSDGSLQSAYPTLYDSRSSYYDIEFESSKLRYGGPGGC